MSDPVTHLNALTCRQMATLLRHAGARHVTADQVRADIAAGAPTNPDGTLSLVPYTAWLAKESGRGS